MTKARWVKDPKEIYRGNGITELVFDTEDADRKYKNSDPIHSFQWMPRGDKIITLVPKKKRKRSKVFSLSFLIAATLMPIVGLVMMQELLTWNDGILYKPYWCIAIILVAIEVEANI